MKKVWITPGCISCGSCAFIAPEVFEVIVSSAIKEEADISKHQELIEKAAHACPVQVIKYQKE